MVSFLLRSKVVYSYQWNILLKRVLMIQFSHYIFSNNYDTYSILLSLIAQSFVPLSLAQSLIHDDEAVSLSDDLRCQLSFLAWWIPDIWE